MITIQAAAEYSINNGTEMAYQVTYSDGTEVRAVVAAGGWIRKEWKKGDEWVAVGKAYIVRANKKRDGERIIQTVKDFLSK